MKPEEQRIAIAEACGYTDVRVESGEYVDIDAREITPWEYLMGDFRGARSRVPDFPNDLNAMHEAEKVLNGVRRAVFEFALLHEVLKRPEPFNYDRGDIMAVITATAAQRAEALLRTLNKWTP